MLTSDDDEWLIEVLPFHYNPIIEIGLRQRSEALRLDQSMQHTVSLTDYNGRFFVDRLIVRSIGLSLLQKIEELVSPLVLREKLVQYFHSRL